MFIKKLYLNGFRNLAKRELTFANSKNLIYGPNGVGKTSVLEAIYFLTFGKSFLMVKREEIANDQLHGFHISTLVEGKRGEKTIAAFYREAETEFFLNDQKSTVYDHVQEIYPLFFSSSTYTQILDHRVQLKKLIDRFIYGVNGLYLRYILRYNRILKQKNHLLKAGKPLPDEKELDSWNIGLAEMGSRIASIRQSFSVDINKQMEIFLKDPLRIEYHASIAKSDAFSQSGFFSALSRVKESELRCGTSMIGPHRDYYDILMADKRINFFSNGEKKKLLLLIYLAYIEMFRNANAEYPVFLLDDFDTAIDDQNLRLLLRLFPALQVIATSVHKKRNFDHYIDLKKEI